MKQTRFMQVMFSAVEREDEELAAQVAGDIEAAKEKGEVDTDEVTYVNLGEGKVMITDKENGEVTVAQAADDADQTYDLIAVPDEEKEKFLHPEADGVTPDESVKTEEHEIVEEHMTGEDVISPNLPCGGLNPEAGHEQSVEVLAQAGPEALQEEEKEFSVKTDNTAVLRIFSDQEFCERLFSEVIESDQTAVVGNLKVEKCADEPDSVVITDETTGDQAKVKVDKEDLEVTELGQKEFKNFSNEEQYEPIFVVGIDPINHVIVDAPVYSEEEGNVLAQRLTEIGVEGVQLFVSPDEARDYAASMLQGAGVSEAEQVAEPEQTEFSDNTIYVTRYFTDCTEFMFKMFSEADNEESATQDKIEEAIRDGKRVECDTETIIPVSSTIAIIEDQENGEFTKAILNEEEIDMEKISKEEADSLMNSNSAESKEDLGEKEFSSEQTSYMTRLFLEEANQDEIEDAIESGEQIENDNEIITPVDSKTAVIEDKVNGEFTKAVLTDEEIEVSKISEEEADSLTGDLEIEEIKEEDKEEKEFSDLENFNVLTKFFSGSIKEATTQSVEAIEDKAMAAIQAIQDVTTESVQAIQEAKESPAPGEEMDLKEAQFSEKDNKTQIDSVLVSWLNRK